MGCKLFYKIIEIFIIVKILVVLYPSMVIQEKRKNLEVSFLDFMVVKEERRIFGSSCFEIHGYTVMSN